jgi:outer membrane immunogenic protein
MVRVLLSSAAVLSLVASASAADLPRRYNPMVTKAEPMYSPVYNWTGFYLGIQGGGAWGDSEWSSSDSFNVSGGLIGGTIGYNWQAGSMVLGLEGDAAWTNISGDTNSCIATNCETSVNWLGTVRGRLGFAFDRIMPFIAGGLAFGNVEANPAGGAGRTETQFGWTIGAGLEVALAGNWTAKAEYLYVDLGDFNCGLACNGNLGNDNVSFTTHIVRGGLNYRF